MTDAVDDWTEDALIAIELCRSWARDVRAKIPCDIYLFGSAIYQGGDQFDPRSSDLDLVVVFHEEVSATERVERLAELQKHKAELELRMIPALGRVDCVQPGVSVVPVTRLEIQVDIHKSGSRQFFDRNIFYDLDTNEQSLSLPGCALSAIADDRRQAIEFVGKIRNRFLAVSANGSGGLGCHIGDEPIPKDLARVAAQLIPNSPTGEWYDTRRGLEYLFAILTGRQEESALLRSLFRKVSVRRGARGRRRSLDQTDQLLLAELLYDVAAATTLDRLADWAIRFVGVSATEETKSRLVDQLRLLVGGLRVRSVVSGSVVIKAQSSERAYQTLALLRDAKVLSRFFDVEHVELSELDEPQAFDGFSTADLLGWLALRLDEWRPHRLATESDAENALHGWLRELDDRAGVALEVVREPAFTAFGRAFVADFAVRQRGPEDSNQMVMIELVRLRSRAAFFRVIERMQGSLLQGILVALVPADRLESFSEDVHRLAHLDGSLRVVLVPVLSD